MNWSDFFYMGGYAFYVWGSYLLTFIIIIVEVATLIGRGKRLAARGARDSDPTKK